MITWRGDDDDDDEQATLQEKEKEEGGGKEARLSALKNIQTDIHSYGAVLISRFFSSRVCSSPQLLPLRQAQARRKKGNRQTEKKQKEST